MEQHFVCCYFPTEWGVSFDINKRWSIELNRIDGIEINLIKLTNQEKSAIEHHFQISSPSYYVLFLIKMSVTKLIPSYDDATCIHCTRTQRFLKTIYTLSCWYSLDSSCSALLDEYPCAMVSVIFQGFFASIVLSKLATCSIRVQFKNSIKLTQYWIMKQPLIWGMSIFRSL